MARKTLLPGYTRVTGTSARIRTPLGDEISQRQYRKIVRSVSTLTPYSGTKKVITNEALAKFNREIDLEKQLARPARGRKGLSKVSEKQRESIVKKRLIKKLTKELGKERAKERRKIVTLRNSAIKKATGKKAKKFSLNMLRPGRLAFQTPFYTYDELIQLIADAKKSGKVFAFTVGINGIDERTGESRTPVLGGLMDLNLKYPESRLNDATDEFMNEHLYMVFLSWYVHFSFKKDYAVNKAARYGLKLGQRKK